MKHLSLLLLTCLALSSQAFSAVGDCQNNLCVMFEVTVKLESHSNANAIINHARSLEINGVAQNYTSRILTVDDICTKQVLVNQAYYHAATAIMNSIVDSSGEVDANLTPAQQSMMMFYSTIMQQTLSFQCTPRDLSLHDDESTAEAGTEKPTTDANATEPPTPKLKLLGTTCIDILHGSAIFADNGIYSVGDILADGSKILQFTPDCGGIVVEKNGKKKTMVVY